MPHIAEDIPWSPKNTWIVITICSVLLGGIFISVSVYELLIKPNSYNLDGDKCVPVRNGTFRTLCDCLDTRDA